MKKRLLATLLTLIAVFSISVTVFAGPLGGSPPIMPTSIELPPYPELYPEAEKFGN